MAKAHDASAGREETSRTAARGPLRLTLLAMAALMAAAFSAAQADEASPTVYSTSKNGQRLRWGPQRPVVSRVVSEPVVEEPTASVERTISTASDNRPAVAVAHVEPTSAAPKSTGAAAADPFDDPFGDRMKAAAQPRRSVATARPMAVVPANPRRLRTVSQRDEAPDFPAPSRTTARGAAIAMQPTPAGEAAPTDLNDSREMASLNSAAKSASHCPEKIEVKSLKDIKTDLKPLKGMLPEECSIVGKPFEPRNWAETTFTWKAAGLCHKPLYFEQPQLERYGHYWGPIVQPILSAGHFFVSIPLLPYNMGLNPPNECMYSLGYYRPGSCSPYMLDPFPLSVRAGLMEAGAITGLTFILP